MINAGKYNRRIEIIRYVTGKDPDGFPVQKEETVLTVKASVKTTKGYTLIANNSDFEKALTNFTIRYPKTPITRDMRVKFRDRIYSIEYLNNVDERGSELEMQCRAVTK